MSLQFRVLGSIAILLLLSLLCGGTLLSLHARSVVEVEVRTAFQGAENSVRDTLQSDVQHTVTMRQVVASFEGQRHVRAALVNEKGKVIVSSEIGRLKDPAPHWFARLMMPATMSARFNINLPQYPCVVELTSDLGPCQRRLCRHASVLWRNHGGGVYGSRLCLAVLPPLPDRPAGGIRRWL
jgi:hypothetical protein